MTSLVLVTLLLVAGGVPGAESEPVSAGAPSAERVTRAAPVSPPSTGCGCSG